MFTLQINEKVPLVSAAKAAKKLGITSRRLRVLAKSGRIPSALFNSEKGWLFPKDGFTIRAGKRGPKLTVKNQIKLLTQIP
jgi:uncharacterized protein (DUF2141 family)